MNLMASVRYECVLPLLSLFLAVTHLGNHFYHVHGSTFRRYAAYDYDLTTPQFTPDGRLLQVEYATNACRRDGSNPIVSVGIGIPSDRTFRLFRKRRGDVDGSPDDDFGDKNRALMEEEGDTILVMATVTSSTLAEAPITYPNSIGNGEDVSREMFSQSSRGDINVRQQFRIIEVPLCAAYNHLVESMNPSRRDITAITTSTILVGLSGHLSDATSLLRTVYSQLEEEQRIFGWHRLGVSPVGQDLNFSDNGSCQLLSQSQSASAQPTETACRLARAAADQCQTHAFGGGLRPLGASLLISAVDTQNNRICHGYQQYGRVAMCETDPSGGIKSLVSRIKTHSKKDSHEDFLSPPKVMVSGGSATSQSKLTSLVQSRLRKLYENSFIGLHVSDDATSGRNKQGSSEGAVESSNGTVPQVCDKNLFTRRALQAILMSLVEEWRSRLDTHLANMVVSDGLTSRFRERIEYDQLSVHPRQPFPQMEVVLVSSRRGSFRLTDRDIFVLLREYFEDK